MSQGEHHRLPGKPGGIDTAYELSDWIPTEAAKAFMRNNRPLLDYIGGKPARFTSKDLVVTRQTGSSGKWQYAEYLRRACAAALSEDRRSGARKKTKGGHQ